MLGLPIRSAVAQSACELGWSAFQQHQWAQAATAYSDCEKASPGKTDALLFRAKALVNLQNFTEAASDLKSYVVRNPGSDDALFLFGSVHFRRAHRRESLAPFARAARFRRH